MHRCGLELDRTILSLGVPVVQRPYHLIQINLVHGLPNFQSHRQADLRPGSFQRNNPRVLQCHRERTKGQLLYS
jgi:hypothetical protein